MIFLLTMTERILIKLLLSYSNCQQEFWYFRWGQIQSMSNFSGLLKVETKQLVSYYVRLSCNMFCTKHNVVWKVHKTNLRIKRIKILSLQECLFKTSTTVWLSDRSKTLEFTIYFPHNSNAITIGKNSLTAIWWQCKDLVQEFANYQIRRHSLYFLMRL